MAARVPAAVYHARLHRLRELMKAANFAAYIVPTSDAHNSEYPRACDARREAITAFTGSAGTAVITDSDARLWTDGRYFLQAETESCNPERGWKLMRDRLPATPSVEEWLAQTLTRGQTVGVDPLVMPVSMVRRMHARLEKAGIVLATAPHENLVDQAWGEARPAPPLDGAFPHPVAFAGRTVASKIADVRAALRGAGAGALVVAALDEVAWLFNVRGRDVTSGAACNPVVAAYGFVTESAAYLCVDAAKVTPELAAHLAEGGVEVRPYAAITELIAATPGRLWLDPANANYALLQAAAPARNDEEARLIQQMSPIQLAKAVKNDAEIAGMRAAHLRDAVALTSFFAWLEAAVQRGIDVRTGAPVAGPLTEFSVGAVLDGMRAAQERYFSLSFQTIAGFGPNGAVIHYRAEAETAREITRDTFLLVDSGGNYLDGTTDVTRTLHFGTPTPHERLCYTRVLQGFIALATATFPPGTSGVALDTIARSKLWQSGLDYRHGTGHGVGAFLCVHEGPQGAASAARTAYEGGVIERAWGGGVLEVEMEADQPTSWLGLPVCTCLPAGMTLTDEPGYYEDGAFGIRIENVLIAQQAETPCRFGGQAFLGFESFTCVPISTVAVDVALLTPAERAWLNGYNAWVRGLLEEKLPPYAREYLARETAAV